MNTTVLKEIKLIADKCGIKLIIAVNGDLLDPNRYTDIDNCLTHEEYDPSTNAKQLLEAIEVLLYKVDNTVFSNFPVAFLKELHASFQFGQIDIHKALFQSLVKYCKKL